MHIFEYFRILRKSSHTPSLRITDLYIFPGKFVKRSTEYCVHKKAAAVCFSILSSNLELLLKFCFLCISTVHISETNCFIQGLQRVQSLLVQGREQPRMVHQPSGTLTCIHSHPIHTYSMGNLAPPINQQC